MKFTKYIFIIALLIFSVGLLEAKEMCTKDTCADVTDTSCQCYCSVKCGPREKIPSGPKVDHPRWNDDYKRCMCDERDEELFEPNKCEQREMETEQEMENE